MIPTEAAGGAPASAGARAELRRQSTASLRLHAAVGAASAVGDMVRRQAAVGVTLGAKAVEGEQVRPVRRVMTREKREVVQGTSAHTDLGLAAGQEKGWTFETIEAEEAVDTVEAEGGLSSAEQGEIRRAVATNSLLSHLNQEQQALVFAKMQALYLLRLY